MKLDVVFFSYGLLDQITKCDDILPCSFLIIDEEIPMSFTHMDTTDPCALESSIIDKFSCTERPYIPSFTDKMFFSSDPVMIFLHFWILEKWSTRKSWWLLEPTKCLKIGWSIWLIFIGSFRWDIEKHIDHKKSFIPLQNALTIFVLHISIVIYLHLPWLKIEDTCLDEEISHLETKTSSIPDTGSTHRSRKSHPRNKGRNPIILVQFRRKSSHNLSALDPDMLPSITILRLSISSETIVYENPFKNIKCKKTIRPSTNDNYRKIWFLGKCENFRKEHDIISRHDIKYISRYCCRLEWWEKRDIDISLEKIWYLHVSMITRRERKSRLKNNLT